MELNLTERQKIKLVCRKIKPQFPSSVEGFLFYSVIQKAFDDLLTDHRMSARRYLSGDMPHAVACGVDPEWIRLIMVKVGLDVCVRCLVTPEHCPTSGNMEHLSMTYARGEKSI